jgi:hypothetical protein
MAHLDRVRHWQKHLTTGVLDTVVIVHPNAPYFDRVVQAVNIVNSVQSYYRLELRLDQGGVWVPRSPRKRFATPLRDRIQQAFSANLVIAMLDHDLDGNITIDEEPGCTIISCADWTDYEDAPPMRVYLVYQLTSALISFAGCLTESENDDLMHGDDDDGEDEPRGCLFDYWGDPKRLILSMVCARLCDKCRASLLMHGTPPEAISATERLLDWIRQVILIREHPMPQSIFVGHGHSDDWKQLRAMLSDWGLQIEEFNEQPVAGVSVSQRLKAMLDRSRFAFLVMTPEDKGDEGRLQARMNVIHEIGLFQGRLGTEYAVVLRERKANLFSNLEGINRLDYDSGRLEGLRAEIHRLLIARGVMRADVPRSPT